MKPKRKVVLLSLGGVLGTLLLGAVSGAGKMLGTDLWPFLRPFVSTVGTFTLAVFAWFAQPVTFPLWSHIVAVLVVVGAIGTLIYITASLMEELSKANAKLNPTLPPLDDNAQ